MCSLKLLLSKAMWGEVALYSFASMKMNSHPCENPNWKRRFVNVFPQALYLYKIHRPSIHYITANTWIAKVTMTTWVKSTTIRKFG
jgi:hypothetical protein